MSAEEIGVPEREFVRRERFDDEFLPSVVFEHEIAHQRIMRSGDSELAGERAPGRELEQIIERDEDAAA